MTDIPELTERDFARAIPARVRRRLIAGLFESGDDVVALRKLVGLSQSQFARAVGISVHTLRNWEQGRRQPEGPAIALLRIASELAAGRRRATATRSTWRGASSRRERERAMVPRWRRTGNAAWQLSRRASAR